MQYLRHFLLIVCCFGALLARAETAAETDTAPPSTDVAANTAADVTTNGAADSLQLEKSLQALSWPQFRSVVEAVPKLKADVDAYGDLGWQYVQMNYKNYRWRKSINRLSDEQRQQLAALIQDARHKK